MYRGCGICASYDLFVVSSVGSSTCGLESSSEVALPVELVNVGRSFRVWVGFIGSGCGEDNRICEVIVFERVGRLLISGHLRVGVCATCMEDITVFIPRVIQARFFVIRTRSSQLRNSGTVIKSLCVV
jgi:hypothetical protein